VERTGWEQSGGKRKKLKARVGSKAVERTGWEQSGGTHGLGASSVTTHYIRSFIASLIPATATNQNRYVFGSTNQGLSTLQLTERESCEKSGGKSRAGNSALL